MKVFFVASECHPFIKTGGLGEVIGSLPQELNKQGLEIRVILPSYSNISPIYKNKMRLIKELIIPVAWRKKTCRIFELEHDGLIYYFVENDYYFDRAQAYQQHDDAERFVFFSRAVLEALPYLKFQPDIIHCHDWQTAMTPVFLKAFYARKKLYKEIKTVFTIHNMHYQGILAREFLGDILGLTEEYFNIDGLEYYGQINILKGGIAYADIITTVSKTYAEEIQTPSEGEGLDGLIRKRKDVLYGILNGIDYADYNPSTDLLIKQHNKTMLQELLKLPMNKEIPMLAIISRLVEQKGLDLILHVLHEILNMDVQLVVLGTGEKKYEEEFSSAIKIYPDKLSVNTFFEDTFARKIYAASDIFLMPSLFEPCGIGQLIAMRYGSVPIVRETGGLKDSVTAFNEAFEGNGFCFRKYNAHDMLYTIQRAVDCYNNKDLWQKIVRNVFASDVSWEKSSKEYIKVYQNCLTYQGGEKLFLQV